MSDLSDRLTEAAAAAIADVAPSLERDIRKVRPVTFELTLANAGRVIEAMASIERRARARREASP